jgi:membrane protease YdiL (CAAX protease family)
MMRAYASAVGVLWIAGSIGGFLYARQQNIPLHVAWPVLLAFLIELTLYLSTGFETVRQLWRPGLLAAAALAPYAAYSAPLGLFQWQTAATLVLAAGIAAHWFEWGDRGLLRELLFLTVMAAVMIAKPFPIWYPAAGGLRVDALGQLMWFRVGLITVLGKGAPPGINFGFVPSRREWLSGAVAGALFLPAGYLLARQLNYMTLQVADGWWWKGPAAFAGAFFVVSAGEEVFFRGILQQRLAGVMGRWPALIVASAAFGLAHLAFRQFPNWNHVAVAALLGVFCGFAFIFGGGVRAPMAAHALAVAIWRAVIA